MHSKKIYFIALSMLFWGTILLPQHVNADTVEDQVRNYFEDIPVMIEIARCESKFRQFDHDGVVLRGGYNGAMVGVFQFFESIHASAALAMGFDLTSLEGNLGYAKHLYETEGTSPWSSAKACWNTAAIAIPKSALLESDIVALQKRIVLLKKLVAELQELHKKKLLTAR